jgi:TonB family protein
VFKDCANRCLCLALRSLLFAARCIIARYFALTATSKSRSRRDDGSASSPPRELRLLPAWPEPFAVFTENLFDLIRERVVPVVETSSAPDHGFWRNIDLHAPFPWRGARDSVFMHGALLGLLYAVSIWPQARVHLADSRSYRTLNGYRLSQYLPELHGAPTHRKLRGKADPVPARQEIRSLPDEPDNLHQTIVTPPKLKLQHDVELPNLVGYKPVLPPPLETSSLSAILHLPVQLPEVAAPTPVIVPIKPQRALPTVQVQPAPAIGSISPKSLPNLAQLLPPVANPVLPVANVGDAQKPQAIEGAPVIVGGKPQRALPRSVALPAPEVGSIRPRGAPNLAQLLPPVSNPIPSPPQAGHAQMPQVVALSAHPAEVQAPPVAIPEGNRRGAFAASPAGHANATGKPGAGDSSGVGSHDASNTVNAPAGISVGASPLPAAAEAVPNAPAPQPAAAEPELRRKLLAAMRPPAIASIPPRPPLARETAGKPTDLENHIFAGRRSYTLLVNMPNLNAAIGSWIIRYVDREQGLVPTPITAPEVVRKSDPAYPGELIDDNVHGTVVLTAIIRADGSVSDIVVAQSLDSQLDQNAAQALSRWVFRPALKNGQPIDLEAVITVPFRTKANGF